MVDWLLTRTMCRQKADERLERNLALLRKNNSPHPEELQMKLSIKPISCVVKSCLPRDAARAHLRQYIDREVILVQLHISTSKELSTQAFASDPQTRINAACQGVHATFFNI
jgi:hypothetical protein